MPASPRRLRAAGQTLFSEVSVVFSAFEVLLLTPYAQEEDMYRCSYTLDHMSARLPNTATA